jgi:glycosyltransferase involved in cell wall biosynthesis
MTLASVIIPVRNGERFLGAALESVLAQTWSPLEIIVVDDGSTDSSAQVAEAFPGVVVRRQPPRGQSVARNRAVRLSQGEFLAFLDADDLWPATKLEVQAGYLRNHPDVGGVLGRQRLIVTAGTALPPWVHREGGLDRVGHGTQPLSLVTRRAVWDRVGPFRPDLAHAEDTDWLLRARDLGVPIEMLEEVVLYRRIHGANLTYDDDGLRRGLALALKGRIDRRRAGSTA